MQYSFASPAKLKKTESINPQAAFVFFTILFGFFEILFLLLEKTKSINPQVILVTVKVKVIAAFVFINPGDPGHCESESCICVYPGDPGHSP